MSASSPKPVILVVDDQPINAKLLEHKLTREGMEVHSVFSGQECLDYIGLTHPDLILLDVMMPEMDGIEVCRRLKANEKTRAIPVIFITARNTKEGKLEGLDAGAADYLTKPVDLEETLARVRTQLRIQQIHRHNIELQNRLMEARQAAAVGAITQGIAHNLNNLLGVVVGYLDLIKTGTTRPDMVKRATALMDTAVQRMVNIVRQLSIITHDERYARTRHPLDGLMQSAIRRFREEHGVEAPIDIRNAAGGTLIETNPEVFEGVIGRLLINAWEAYPRDHEGERLLEVECFKDPKPGTHRLLIKVLDRGAGIAPEIEHTLYEAFVTTKTSVGRGLGLTIARHSVRNLDGDLHLENRPGGGAVATITYPLPRPAEAAAAA